MTSPEAAFDPSRGEAAPGRRLRFERRVAWPHHRAGWGWLEPAIEREFGASDAPTLFTSSVETLLREHPFALRRRWAGISHQVLDVSPRWYEVYGQPIGLHPVLSQLRASLPWCRGLYALSEHAKLLYEKWSGRARWARTFVQSVFKALGEVSLAVVMRHPMRVLLSVCAIVWAVGVAPPSLMKMLGLRF